MAATKNATYKIFNGTDWDTYYFQTSASQVGETTNLKFLHLDTHTVNGKSFTATGGITLTGEDIKVNTQSGALPISTTINGINSALSSYNTSINNIIDGSQSVGKACCDEDGNDIVETYATKTELSNGLSGKISSTSVGVANGVASLDTNGKVPSTQLPSFVDDVIEGSMSSDGSTFTPTAPNAELKSTGKIYVDINSNKTYRWGSSKYTEISASLALGETSSTAYAGNKGKANATNIATLQGYFTDGIANKAKKDDKDNIISATYQSKKLDDLIVVNGNTTNADTVVGVLNNLTTFCNGISGTYATKNEVKDAINNTHKIFTGSTTPTGMKSGDIWLQY